MTARPLLLAPLLVLVACGGTDGPIEPTYENVAAVIERSCATASPSCHGGVRGSARLNFEAFDEAGLPYTDALVNVEACEYSFLDLVTPGDPDRSWLMLKLEHEYDADGNLIFTPDPAWDPMLATNADGSLRASTCPQVDRGELGFGTNMPQNLGRPSPLSEAEITLFREWILIGAPGPI